MWAIANPRKKRRRRRKSSHKRMRAAGIANYRRRKRSYRKRRRSNPRRKVVVITKFRNRGRKKGYKRRHRRRRNPAIAVPSTSKLFQLMKNGLAIAGGIAAPKFLEPMLPVFGDSPTAMIARKVAALVLPGIAVQFGARYVGLSRKTVNLVWAGIGVNAAIQALEMFGYSVPGLSAGPDVPAPAPLVSNQLGVGGTFSDVPQRLQSPYMQ